MFQRALFLECCRRLSKFSEKQILMGMHEVMEWATCHKVCDFDKIVDEVVSNVLPVSKTTCGARSGNGAVIAQIEYEGHYLDW